MEKKLLTVLLKRCLMHTTKIDTSPVAEILLTALKLGFTSFDRAPGGDPSFYERVAISGDELAHLMRKFGKTIRGLSKTEGITQKRIREWRRDGLQGFYAVNAVYCITGIWIR